MGLCCTCQILEGELLALVLKIFILIQKTNLYQTVIGKVEK